MPSVWPGRVGMSLALALLLAFGSPRWGNAQSQNGGQGPVADVVARVAPGVVMVTVERDVSLVEGFLGDSYGGVARGAGSGVVMDRKGLILTNHHVVERASWVGVELHDGRKLEATIVGADAGTDLALLRVQAGDLPAVPFCDSDGVRPGETALAMGAPFGLKHSVTAGVISATGRRRTSHGVTTAYLQTDAQINPGNSGGPLVNLRGEVVGINSFYLGQGTGIGFAVPSNLARRIGRELQRAGRVQRGYVGFEAQSLTPEMAEYFRRKDHRGAVITKVYPGSPASRVGLQPGDVVIGFGNQAVPEADVLLERVAQSPVGSTQGILLQRAGKRLAAKLKVEAVPTEPPDAASETRDNAPMLGLQVRTLTRALRMEFNYRGSGRVVITGVVPGSAADRAGLSPGLAILDANLEPVQRAGDLIEPTKGGRALLRVENRDGNVAYVLVRRSRSQ